MPETIRATFDTADTADLALMALSEKGVATKQADVRPHSGGRHVAHSDARTTRGMRGTHGLHESHESSAYNALDHQSAQSLSDGFLTASPAWTPSGTTQGWGFSAITAPAFVSGYASGGLDGSTGNDDNPGGFYSGGDETISSTMRQMDDIISREVVLEVQVDSRDAAKARAILTNAHGRCL